MQPTLWTMGYGSWKETRRRLGGMLAALQQAEITTLIDIRHSPCASDPSAGGNYSAQSWNLQAAGGIDDELKNIGIEYRWLVEMGNPQKRDPEMAVLRGHLDSNSDHWPVNRGLKMLADYVHDSKQRCCLLCACAEYVNCHRRPIAESLSSRFFAGELSIVDLGRSGPLKIS